MSYKPVVGGKASVCNWSLRAEFKTKEQAQTAINKILALEVDISCGYEKYMDETHDIHCVVVSNMSWANNLIFVANILKSVDYNLDDE